MPAPLEKWGGGSVAFSQQGVSYRLQELRGCFRVNA
jgi:hypothetical protein